jgi:tripartite-type tricarboxylate transporter receptor subunit TctC
MDDKPSAAMPEARMLGDNEPALRGANVTVWQGIFVPKDTPKKIVIRLNDALVAVLQEPGVRKNFAAGGVTVIGLGPAEFSRFLQEEQTKFGAVVAKGQIKAE